MNNFIEVENQLSRLNQVILKLKRRKKIQNLLKLIGVGFLIYQNINQEISNLTEQKKLLIKRLNTKILDHVHYLNYERGKIESSKEFLSKLEQEKWFKTISNLEKAILHLKEIEGFDEQQIVEITNQINSFNNFIANFNEELEKEKLRQKIQELKESIGQAKMEFDSLYISQNYFSKKDLHIWKNKWLFLKQSLEEYVKKCNETNEGSDISKIIDYYKKGPELIKIRNEEFLRQELERFKNFFDTVESNPLTEKQRRAIVIDEENNLVVAGAGTGKTSTIVGKACYLIEKGLAKPDEILLIAFNNDVVKEMKKRMKTKLEKSPKIKTYHSLGLEIIGESNGKKPTTSDLASDKVKQADKINILISERMNEEDFVQKINDYFLYHSVPYKTIFEFNSFGEYIDFIKKFDIRSLKGDSVKSFEECDIANFLYVNQIEYIYEHPYEFDTATSKHRRYRPDFYLPKYGIYIEHFGVDRKGKTAPYVDQAEYTKQMLWKRETHKTNKTQLIETFSYEKQERKLLTTLEKKLKEKGVIFNKLPREEIFERLNELGKVNQFAILLRNFLNLFKASGKSLSEILQNEHLTDRDLAFLDIFSKIYESYTRFLEKNQEIDFNDMINHATQLLTEKKYQSKFKYILVDEFQDISKTRYLFLKALLSNNNSKLFAVGDDWQSIYRFTGSDLSLMVDFEKHFGFSERCFLDETFRFNNKICNFSTKFILQNPIQIEKTISSTSITEDPAVSIFRDNRKSALKEILCKIDRQKTKKQTVFIIGRYKFLKPDNLKELDNDFSDIKIKFTTAHKSKGLEADYVILIGLSGGEYGFPCEITDDPLLNLVLTRQEPFPNAEERRLFYVALTRAKKHVFLVVDDNPTVSSFILEIEKSGYEFQSFGSPHKISNCPVCESGTIIKKNGKYGPFYSCNNFPYCEYNAKTCPQCNGGFLQRKGLSYECSSNNCSFRTNSCPVCGNGYLIRRKGRRGYFFGCSNYPDCRYTTNDSSKVKKLGYIS